ncbi:MULTISPECIES: hypothetical protein [unclassified Bradyrhizobium]|uniref:hypothetical protein n=1 Tax=unclassified Bradyrhizobium TaxID=2631580 RepID=UPI0028E1B433|nr:MULTISPECIES: hypothetical protein [unclassified Bradyrhizobium]
MTGGRRWRFGVREPYDRSCGKTAKYLTPGKRPNSHGRTSTTALGDDVAQGLLMPLRAFVREAAENNLTEVGFLPRSLDRHADRDGRGAFGQRALEAG